MPAAAASKNGSTVTATHATPRSTPSTGSNSSPSPRRATMCSGSWRICRSIAPASVAGRGCKLRPICTAATSSSTSPGVRLSASYKNLEKAGSSISIQPHPDLESPAQAKSPSGRCRKGIFQIKTLLERLLLVEHRSLRRFFRSPEAIAEGCEDRHALRGVGKVRGRNDRKDTRTRRLRVHFLRRPQRQARRTKVVLDQATDREQLEVLGVAEGAERVRRQTGDIRALVVGNLRDVVADRTQGPFAEGLGGGEVDVEDITLGVVIDLIGRVEFAVNRSAQVPAVLQIREDAFRLEGPVLVAEVAEAVEAVARDDDVGTRRTLNGPVRSVDAETRLNSETAGSELPAQFNRHEVGVVDACEHVHLIGVQCDRLTDAHHTEGLHDDGVVGSAEERPSGDEQETLRIDRSLHTLTGTNRAGDRARQVRLIGEDLIEHVDARRRDAGAGADEHARF